MDREELERKKRFTPRTVVESILTVKSDIEDIAEKLKKISENEADFLEDISITECRDLLDIIENFLETMDNKLFGTREEGDYMVHPRVECEASFSDHIKELRDYTCYQVCKHKASYGEDMNDEDWDDLEEKHCDKCLVEKRLWKDKG